MEQQERPNESEQHSGGKEHAKETEQMINSDTNELRAKITLAIGVMTVAILFMGLLVALAVLLRDLGHKLAAERLAIGSGVLIAIGLIALIYFGVKPLTKTTWVGRFLADPLKMFSPKSDVGFILIGIAECVFIFQTAINDFPFHPRTSLAVIIATSCVFSMVPALVVAKIMLQLLRNTSEAMMISAKADIKIHELNRDALTWLAKELASVKATLPNSDK